MSQRRFAFLLLASLILIPNSLETLNAESLQFNGQTAYTHVLSQLSYGPRIPGSDSLLATASYIRSNLSANGWNVVLQNFTYQNNLLERTIEGHNIIATPPPEGANGSLRILLGAHYDTRPFADGPKSENHAVPVPGANDGASGVAVLLELGRVLAARNWTAGLTMVFFDGEDSGLYSPATGWIQGSLNYVQSLTSFQRQQIKAAIIVDFVGDSDLVLRREALSDYAISSDIWRQGRALGYTQFADGIQPALIDDHRPFLDRGIRAIDIIDFDYPYWHTPDDTADKVSPNSLEAVGRTLEAYLLAGNLSNPTMPPGFSLVLGALLATSALAAVVLYKARKAPSSL